MELNTEQAATARDKAHAKELKRRQKAKASRPVLMHGFVRPVPEAPEEREDAAARARGACGARS